MKKFIRLVSVLALTGVTLAYTGCADFSTDFEDINNRLDALEQEAGKLKTLEEQVAGLKTTITALETAKSQLEASVKTLNENSASKADVEALKTKIASLESELAKAASKADVEALSKELAAAKKLLDNYVTSDVLNAKVAELQKMIDEAKALIPDNLDAEFKAVKDEIMKINTWTTDNAPIIGQLQSDVADLLADAEAIHTEIEQLTEITNNLNGSVNDLSSKVTEEILPALESLKTASKQVTEYIQNLPLQLKEITDKISSLQTDVEELQNAIKTLVSAAEADAKYATKTEVEAVEKAISATIEEALQNEGSISKSIAAAVAKATTALQSQIDVLTGMIKEIASQIQSIVYVPEYSDGMIKANQYVLGVVAGTDKPAIVTDWNFVATFEVTPHALAAGLTSKNVGISTVAVKAAPAETFDVTVVSTDAASGRVVVKAVLPEESEAYKQISANKKIAVALNVANYGGDIHNIGEDTTIDTNCWKSSSYVTVVRGEVKELNKCVEFYTTDENGKETVISGCNKDFKVAYSATDSQKNLFEGFAARIVADDLKMTIDDANEYFGTNIRLTPAKPVFTYSKVVNGVESPVAKINSPVYVTENSVLSTAEIKPISGKVEGTDMVGYKVAATLPGFSLNGVAVDPQFTYNTTYEITRQAEYITYTESDLIKWVPAHKGLNPSVQTHVNQQVVDLYKKGTVVPQEPTVKVNGKQPKVAIDFTAEVDPATGIMYVKNLPYVADESVVYDVTLPLVINGTIQYDLQFRVNLGAMPSAKDVKLGKVVVEGNYAAGFTKAISPIDAIYTGEDKAFYSSLTKEEFAAAFVAELAASEYENLVVIQPSATDEWLAPVNLEFNITWDADTKKETSNIWVDAAYSQLTLPVEKTVTVFGVTYTYKATVEFKLPEYKLATNPLRGTIDNGDYYVTVGGKQEFGGANWKLDVIDLASLIYLNVSKPITDALEVEFYQYVPDGAVAPLSEEAAEEDPYKLIVTATVAKDGTLSLPEDYVYDWPIRMTASEVKAVLKSTSTKLTLGEQIIVMTTQDVIKRDSFGSKTGIKPITVTSGADATAQLVTYLTGKDYNDKPILNESAKTFANVWDKTKANGNVETANYYKIYGQEITFGARSEIKIYSNYGTAEQAAIPQTLVSFEYDDENGVLTLNANNANLVGSVTFVVPVSLEYCTDNFEPVESTIAVTFTK